MQLRLGLGLRLVLFLLLRLGILNGAIGLSVIDEILDTIALRLRLVVGTRSGVGGLVTCRHGCVCYG